MGGASRVRKRPLSVPVLELSIGGKKETSIKETE